MYTARGTIDKSHLLESYLPLVRKIAVQMMARLPASVELDDLIQAGRIGLLDAWQRFEENTAASFATFASQRVRGAILDELRAMDWVPRRVRQSARQVEQAIQSASHQAGRAPTEPEIARALNMSLDEYHELLVEIQGCQLVYAEDLKSDDADGSPFDQQAAPGQGGRSGDDPIAALLGAEFRGRLAQAIGQLPEREARVLSLYYQEDMNLREIASVLEVNPSRASQLHNQAITRLRTLLKDVI
ncbi:RNA polymerase sigma factor FliA [Ramlibacter sp.]|uniref:RNA polymerase sigma factor FliA n=1 Tax=Ramlibacter sp. TaxID=1917967 RepID=UPI002BBD034D|nr:RNA polymerase sigma factor FliA [Ramlibacter sp.]HWI83350.1 RNA polymerase sigma factor FliA [Ramlibacter sp.]